MTWNVHSCRSARLEPSLELVAEVIGTVDPDIVALQEVDAGCPRTGGVDQAVEIAKRLGMKSHFCCLVDWEQFSYSSEPAGRFGLAFLCRECLHPHRVERWELPLRSHRSEPRGIFQLEVDWDGTSIVLMNTHLSVQRAERIAQLIAVRERVLRLRGDGEPCILLGDFNTFGYSRQLQLLERLLVDCSPWRSASATFPSNFPVLRLDRVYATADLRCRRSSVVSLAEARAASDHLPVCAELARR